MSGTVICGIDDPVGAARAAGVARELAERLRLPLLYVHVAGPADGVEKLDAAEDLLRSVADASTGVAARWTVEEGHAADRLVALAEERDASFVVVGCHGPRSSLLGSISADVSRRAPCPVVVVPPGVPAGLLVGGVA